MKNLLILFVAALAVALPVPNQIPAFDTITEITADWDAGSPTPRSEASPSNYCATCVRRRVVLDRLPGKRTEDKQGGIAPEKNVGGNWFTKRTEDGGGGKRNSLDGGYYVEKVPPHDRRSLNSRKLGGKESGWNSKHVDVSDDIQRAKKRQDDADDMERANKRGGGEGRRTDVGKIDIRVDNMGNKHQGYNSRSDKDTEETDMQRANQTPAM